MWRQSRWTAGLTRSLSGRLYSWVMARLEVIAISLEPSRGQFFSFLLDLGICNCFRCLTVVTSFNLFCFGVVFEGVLTKLLILLFIIEPRTGNGSSTPESLEELDSFLFLTFTTLVVSWMKLLFLALEGVVICWTLEEVADRRAFFLLDNMMGDEGP